MGRPIVHFELVGPDGAALREFYTTLFDWDFQVSEEMQYGTVTREDNQTPDGIGIGGGVGQGPPGYQGHVTFYAEVPDVEAALTQAEAMGAKRMMGPERIMADLVIGQFTDPAGNLVGVMEPRR